MITPFVKSFIEKNIDLIEDKKYSELIPLWDKKAIRSDYGPEYFDELVFVFDNINVDFLALTENARKQQLFIVLQNTMKGIRSVTDATGEIVMKGDLLKGVYCSFGLDIDTQIDIMDKAAESLNLTVFDDFYRF